MQVQQDSNLQPTVLETVALPIGPCTCLCGYYLQKGLACQQNLSGTVDDKLDDGCTPVAGIIIIAVHTGVLFKVSVYLILTF